MRKRIELENLFTKYLNDSLTPEETKNLAQWLEIPGNKRIFDEYVRQHYDLQTTMQVDRTEEAYAKIRDKITGNSLWLMIPVWSRYAAAIAIFLVMGLGYFYSQKNFTETPVIVPVVENITLELGNGEIEIIHPGSSKTFTDLQGNILGKQETDRLTYTPHSGNREIVYNTLRVPYGRKFEVGLADGTIVNLQSGTSLRFPTGFDQDFRRVFLEGEAYFEVAENVDLPFIVVTDELYVQVTGTAFNVSAYPEDVFIDVVLEEGGVGLYTPASTMEAATMLAPGYIGSLDRRDNSIVTEKVNTSIYTNWLEGKLSFRNMPFDNILKKLERHYNVKMVNHNKKLGSEIFNASFDKDETIENVLGYFNESYKIEFTINDNTVIIQ